MKSRVVVYGAAIWHVTTFHGPYTKDFAPDNRNVGDGLNRPEVGFRMAYMMWYYWVVNTLHWGQLRQIVIIILFLFKLDLRTEKAVLLFMLTVLLKLCSQRIVYLRRRRQGGYVFVFVCLSVCMSVCLSARKLEKLSMNLHKISGRKGFVTSNSWLDF